MIDDLFDEFLGFDFIMGADMVKCPHCGTDVPCSLFFEDKVGGIIPGTQYLIILEINTMSRGFWKKQ